MKGKIRIMTDDDQKSTAAQVTLQLSVADASNLRPEAANWFHFTGTEGEVQMLVGYVDTLQAHMSATAISRGEDPKPIAPTLTHRIVLSDKGFERLRDAVNEMSKIREARRS